MYKELEAGSFNDFQKLFSQKNFDVDLSPRAGFVYRGQSDSGWGLKTTLQRLIDSARTRGSKQDSVETFTKDHLKQFRLQIRGRRGSNPRDLEDDDLWALGQHYGLATPLLDWSLSPYIALFFSFSEVSNAEYRAVWCLNRKRIEGTLVVRDPQSLAAGLVKSSPRFLVPEIDENSRLIAQSGLFTKIKIDERIESYVNDLDGYADTLVKILIVNKNWQREEILHQLNLMNINYSTLFPDLEGSCRYANSVSEGLYKRSIGVI